MDFPPFETETRTQSDGLVLADSTYLGLIVIEDVFEPEGFWVQTDLYAVMDGDFDLICVVQIRCEKCLTLIRGAPNALFEEIEGEEPTLVEVCDRCAALNWGMETVCV